MPVSCLPKQPEDGSNAQFRQKRNNILTARSGIMVSW